MNAKVLAEVALKVWGVVLIIGALLSIPTALWMIWAVPAEDTQAAWLRASQIAGLLSIVVQVTGGVVVLIWADRIVSMFELNDAPLQIGIDHAQLQVLAFAIVGVFVLLEGTQNVAGAAYTMWNKPDLTETMSYMWGQEGQNMVKAVVQIAAGLFLIIGREGLARGWSRLIERRAEDPADPDRAD